jgi:peroxiredoxin
MFHPVRMSPWRSASFACALALAGCQGAKSGPSAQVPEGDPHPLVGSVAPTFDLPAQSGGERASLAAARGKVALVDFWATWCEPCRQSFPQFEALAKRYGGDLVVIGISEDDEPDTIADFAKDTGATFPLAWDKDKELAGQYRPEAMPTTYIIDRNGLIRVVHAGYHAGDERTIAEQVESLRRSVRP